MNRNYKNKEEVEAILKEALWLAWNAAGGPAGMGVFQDNPGTTKEDVWNNAVGPGDYPVATSRDGYLNADYVFGRMMKLRLDYGDTHIEVPDWEPRSDYQAWCTKYPTFESLINAAEKNLDISSST
jgi:hypothetical protein